MSKKITYKILAPNEGGRDEKQSTNDFKNGIWRIYFYNSNFSNEVKEAYIDRMALKFKIKIDNKNTDIVRNYLENWATNFLRNKKFEDIEQKFKIIL